MPSADIERRTLKYFTSDFDVEDWNGVERELQGMLDESIASAEELAAFIEKVGEFGDLLSEAAAWKYIRMSQHADDPALSQAQTDFYEKVIAPSQPFFSRLDRKMVESGHFSELPAERYGHLGKLLRREFEIYRDQNVPLFVRENELTSKYSELYSALTVDFEGEEKTLKEMVLVQRDPDRARREKAWRLVADRTKEARGDFERLFDELKEVRQEIARNAGFDNYRDYTHAALGRFDYTPEDLERFHASIEALGVPALRRINEKRRKALGVPALRPWDMQVGLDGKILSPFEDAPRLIAGVKRILGRIDPEFSALLGALEKDGCLDLANRKGKAPGGYNYPLSVTGGSFIFMNAVGLAYDVNVLTHEMGHGVNAYRCRQERIAEYREGPAEVAELASMSMELMASEYLGEFYGDPADERKARRELLEDALTTLPNVAAIDAFQHWIYLNPECGPEERNREFRRLEDRFDAGVDWSGLEEEEGNAWLRVMLIFEVPFYYIEYALAQLGAFAIYKAYKEDPEGAVAGYKRFTALGYSKPVPELYEAAGIRFDFSEEYIRELTDFIVEEWEKNER